MARVMFLGGEETGNVAFVDWGRFRFHIHKWVECGDQHILAKAAGNRFFRVYGGGGIPPVAGSGRNWAPSQGSNIPVDAVAEGSQASQGVPDALGAALPTEVPPQPKKRRGRPPGRRAKAKADLGTTPRPPMPTPSGYGFPTEVEGDGET